jgi:hypothetical protein
VLQAQLNAKKAQVQEAHLRIKQAERRVARLTAGPREMSPYGAAQPRMPGGAPGRALYPADQPPERPVNPTPPSLATAPGQPGGPPSIPPPPRPGTPTTAPRATPPTPYGAPTQPGAPVPPLPATSPPHVGAPPAGVPVPPSPQLEGRLKNLEQKIQTLQKEVESLRRQVRDLKASREAQTRTLTPDEANRLGIDPRLPPPAPTGDPLLSPPTPKTPGR